MLNKNSFRLIGFSISLFICLIFNQQIFAQSEPEFLNGDLLPNAPELSARGNHKVGVRTLEFIHGNQPDILHSKGGVAPLYDRNLKVEVWYPAQIPNDKEELVTYNSVLGVFSDPGRPLTPFEFKGRALRDANPEKSEQKFPLVLVSHGYLGSRLLLTYLTENLASKGYVVVAIDHKESTYSDAGGFQSTLLNRAKDILFILDEISKSSVENSGSFLSGLADANNTGIIGYSMGGYGVLNVAGVGYSQKAAGLFASMTEGSKEFEVLTTGNADYDKMRDSRIKAVVAFAPWGMQRGVWDNEGLKGLKLPTLFIAGDQDDISGYEDGIKAIYNGAINSDRFLLTYKNARHNIAPNPPPALTYLPGKEKDYAHYAEPAWNERRINNINQHFVTAFLGIHLKELEYQKFLDVQANSNEKNWVGFPPRYSVGLELLHEKP